LIFYALLSVCACYIIIIYVKLYSCFVVLESDVNRRWVFFPSVSQFSISGDCRYFSWIANYCYQ